MAIRSEASGFRLFVSKTAGDPLSTLEPGGRVTGAPWMGLIPDSLPVNKHPLCKSQRAADPGLQTLQPRPLITGLKPDVLRLFLNMVR